jgi:hypothetical protein
VAAQSKACVYCLSLPEIAGSNPVGGMDVSSCECCLWSGKDVCDGPIPRLEESYRVCVCASLSVIRCNNNPLHLQCVRRRGETKKETNIVVGSN